MNAIENTNAIQSVENQKKEAKKLVIFHFTKDSQANKLDKLLNSKHTMKQLVSNLIKNELTERTEKIVAKRILTHIQHLRKEHMDVVYDKDSKTYIFADCIKK